MVGSRPPRVFRPLSIRRFDALILLIRRYEREASRAAEARLYYAACALIGSALEGAILAMCTVYDKEVETHLRALPSNQRPPRAAQDWTLNHCIKIASALGWLPTRNSLRSRRKIGDWVHLVRELRNLIHPGKHVRDYPRIRIAKAHWGDARAVFKIASENLEVKVVHDLRKEIKRRGL